MNPQSAAPSILDRFNPETAVHVAIGVIIALIIYHFMFQR